jgi:DNA-directed RNA polymerase specialized sigma24 family protein
MVDQEVVAKWVVNLAVLQNAEVQSERFTEAAQLAWPRVLVCTRRSVSNRQISSSEALSLALEIWEVTLRSVWNTLQQDPDGEARIENLTSYLIGAFHHRLNQHLKRDKQRDAVLEFMPPEELMGLEQPGTAERACEFDLYRKIQLTELYTAMDENVRQALIARTHGFSWREIATEIKVDEQNLIMRVQYAIRKLRDKFSRLPNGPKAELKSI